VGRMFMLIADPVKSMEEMHRFLSDLHTYCFEKQPVGV
jgi:hypothetical protein